MGYVVSTTVLITFHRTFVHAPGRESVVTKTF